MKKSIALFAFIQMITFLLCSDISASMPFELNDGFSCLEALYLDTLPDASQSPTDYNALNASPGSDFEGNVRTRQLVPILMNEPANSREGSSGDCNVFKIANKKLIQNRYLEARFEAKDFRGKWSFLMELQIDQNYLEFVEYVSTDLENLTLSQLVIGSMRPAYIFANWVTPDGKLKHLEDGSDVITLRFKVKKGGKKLSEVIQMSSMYHDSEILGYDYGRRCLDLEFKDVLQIDVKPDSGIDQEVWPNPFNSRLNINIEADVSQSINVRLINVQGQVIYSDRYQVFAGKNRIELINIDSDQMGVMILQVESDHMHWSRQLIRVE